MFNIPVTSFLKRSRAEFREILTSGSQEIGVFPRKLFRNQSQYFSLLGIHCIYWVLSVKKKNLRIAKFFASLRFLTYIFNERVKHVKMKRIKKIVYFMFISLLQLLLLIVYVAPMHSHVTNVFIFNMHVTVCVCKYPNGIRIYSCMCVF